MTQPAPHEEEKKAPLPPGMVLGPDGKPCKACHAFTSFANFKKKPISASKAAVPAVECPADSLTLGRHTWTFLHTTAAYFPPTPSPHQKSSMLSLLRALPTLYPCTPCADELGEYMRKPGNDPSAAVELGRVGVERWLCDVHNEVNGRLGKEMFDCGGVGERWRDGPKDGSCD